MADQWYFSWDKNEFGPFSAARLRELAAQGRLQALDTVWKEGMQKRVRADRIKNLFPGPEIQALPAKAILPVFSSHIQPSDSLSTSIPNSGAKLDAWLPSPHDQATAGDPLQEIPDGLMLRAIPGQIDWAPPVSPASINPANSKKEEPSLEICPPLSTGQAIVVSGAVITSQDGEIVRYRKKCSKCGYKDVRNITMPISNEVIRTSFFCPKCRKIRDVVIQGNA